MSRIPSASPEVGVIRTYVDWLIGLPWNVSTDDLLDIKEAAKILDEDHYGLEKIKERILEYLAVRVARRQDPQPDPRLRRPARRRQDVARQERRPGDGPQVRPDEPRRHPRRGRDPRPPPDLHRRAARPDHPERQDGRLEQPGLHARRGRQDRHGLPWRPVVGAARGPRPGAEQHLPGQLPGGAVRPQQGAVHRDGQPARPDPGAPPRPDGDHPAAGLHPAGEDRDRQAVPHPEADGEPRPQREDDRDHRRGDDRARPAPTPRRPASGTSSARSRTSCARSPARWPRAASARRSSTSRSSSSSSARRASSTASSRPRTRRARRPASWSPRSVATWSPIEVTKMDGKEDFILTGQLGEVMRESARAGLSWIRAHAAELGIRRETFEKNTLHIHVPAGGIPKDGPSAGITMATAMVSAFTGIPVRKDVAMTGEITLRGRVLPIGGLKSKILAAHLAGREDRSSSRRRTRRTCGTSRRRSASRSSSCWSTRWTRCSRRRSGASRGPLVAEPPKVIKPGDEPSDKPERENRVRRTPLPAGRPAAGRRPRQLTHNGAAGARARPL